MNYRKKTKLVAKPAATVALSADEAAAVAKKQKDAEETVLKQKKRTEGEQDECQSLYHSICINNAGIFINNAGIF